LDRPASSSPIGRIRDFLFRPSSLSLVAVVAVGMFSGLVFWGGFNTGMEATNSLEFCNSCHEMRDTVFQEYKETVHYQNRSGVRAICSDCHVPRDWVHKFVRKVGASQELYVKFVSGAIDTPESSRRTASTAQRV
jgi:cytochrome c-type protein NapC